jgi:hypothetical protein
VNEKAFVLQRSDRSYRRGLVLGFTVAEIFLLLLFLLLLALAALLADLIKDRDMALQSLATAKEKVDELQALTNPNDVERRKRLDELVERYKLDEQRIEALILSEKSARERQQALDEALKALDALKSEVERLQKDADLAKAIDQIAQERNLNREQVLALAAAAAELTKNPDDLRTGNDEVEGMRQQLGDLADKLAAAGKTIESISQEKGIDPPCWYVEQTVGEKIKEQPIFMFDVAVFDDYLLVRDRPTPERYLAERATLPLDGMEFMKPISDDQFGRIMQPIRRMGKEKKVRSYSCVFYVQVWDQTSPGAKERWKHATEVVIGGAFYRATVSGSPW